MSIASQSNIIRILSGYNQWWQTRSVQKQFLKPAQRTVFREALRFLREGEKRVIYMAGPHRTGKTALIHQLIHQCISDGTDPKHIVYMNFAHPFFSFLPIDRFYSAFFENICPDGGARTYCFFDDVQLSPGWEKSIDRFCRQYPQATVIASAAVRPETVSKEAVLLHMPPISFYEYCQIAAGTAKIVSEPLPDCRGLLEADPSRLRSIAQMAGRFRRQFMRYLYTCGFLNLVGESDDIKIQRMIQKTVVGDALLRDISICYNVRSSVELEKIFLYLSFECPSVISFEAVMRDVDCVTRPTIEKYVQYLEKACLLYQCFPYEFAGDRMQKVQPKIYLADAAIHNSLLMLNDVRISEGSMDKIVETAVYRHLRFSGPDHEERQIFYQRGRSGGKNLDMILGGEKPVFLDVRYDSDVRLSRKDAILARSGDAALCLVITKADGMFGRVPDLPDNIFCIPASVFLFLIGHAKAEGRDFLAL